MLNICSNRLKPFKVKQMLVLLCFSYLLEYLYIMLVVWFLCFCFYCLRIVFWPSCIRLRLALCLNTKMKCEGLNVYKMTEIRKSKMGKWTTLTHQNWTTKDQKNSPRPPQSPDLRAAEQLWDVVELEVCISSWQICKCDTIMSMQSKISQKCFHIKAALNPGLPGCT